MILEIGKLYKIKARSIVSKFFGENFYLLVNAENINTNMGAEIRYHFYCLETNKNITAWSGDFWTFEIEDAT
jgi:hypothetical protein